MISDFRKKNDQATVGMAAHFFVNLRKAILLCIRFSPLLRMAAVTHTHRSEAEKEKRGIGGYEF